MQSKLGQKVLFNKLKTMFIILFQNGFINITFDKPKNDNML